MNYTNTDIGSLLVSNYQGIGSLTAGGVGDNTAINGNSFYAGTYGSGKILVVYTATLAATKTLSLKVELKHSEDNVTFISVTIKDGVIATGGAGGSTETGVFEYDFNREKLGAYVKVTVTPDLNAANTDTATVAFVNVYDGGAANPVSKG